MTAVIMVVLAGIFSAHVYRTAGDAGVRYGEVGGAESVGCGYVTL